MMIKRPATNWAEFNAKAKHVLAALEEGLLPQHKGEIIAVEPESGDYFLGFNPMEAGDKAKAKYPDKLFFFARIGGGGVTRFHGRWK